MPDYKLTGVDMARITNTANSIADDIKELNAIQAEIKNNIVPLLDQHWQGLAKQSFDNRITVYLAGYSGLVDGYSQLNDQLKKAGEAYGGADNEAKQIIAKLPK